MIEWTTAPTDAACDRAWGKILEIARAHALVMKVSAEVVILVPPEVQRRNGDRAAVLLEHEMIDVKRRDTD